MIKLKDLLFEIDLQSKKQDFLKHHFTGHIPSHSYVEYEKDGGLSWLGNKSKYKKLIDSGVYGEYNVEFRLNGEKLRYVDVDDNGNINRDVNGNAIYMSSEKIREKKIPEEDTTLVAFVGDKPIGFASNEFGSVGVWVEKKYQKNGIGTALLEKHISLRPDSKSSSFKIGQMTNAGINMTNKYYDMMTKKHGEYGVKW